MSSTGAVKQFNGVTGFIQPDDGSADVFVYFKDVVPEGLKGMGAGKKVKFDAVENPRVREQLKAINVRIEEKTISDAEVTEEGSEVSKVPSIDLHGWTVEEAKESTVNFLEQQFTDFEDLRRMPACMDKGFAFVEIVTGRGNHSENSYCKIKAAICELVSQMGLEFEHAGASSGRGLNKQGNQGALHVRFPPPKTDRKELRKYQLSKPEVLDDLVRRSEEREREKKGGGAKAAGPGKGSKEHVKGLGVPSPAEKNITLKKLCQCMNNDFLTEHGLKHVTGNQIAKITYSEFEKIFTDFQANASKPECTAYLSIIK